MTTHTKHRITAILLPAFFFLLLLLVWYGLSVWNTIPPILLPGPQKVVQALDKLLASGELVRSLLVSMYRILLGFMFSIITAVPLGLWIGFSKKSKAMLEPFLAFVRYIPPSAFIPLLIVWFGITEIQKVAVIYLAIAPYLCLMVADHAVTTKTELVHAALTLGAKRSDVFWKVVVPHSMPGTWDSGRIMLGASWSFVILSEIVGSNKGLGHLIVESQRYLNTANIFAAILVIGFVGLISDLCLQLASKKIFIWFHNHHATHQ